MRPSRPYAAYALGLLASANFLHYANRNLVVTMYDDLRGEFGFSNAELGMLGTAFMLTHAVGTVVFGWLGDRLDRRRLMAAGVLVWSTAALGATLATGLYTLLLSRALVGLGTATCVPVANALICDVFPAESKARSVAVFNLGLFFGGIGGVVLGRAGFPLAFTVVALPGFLVALALWRLRVGGAAEGSSAPESSPARFFSDAARVFAVPTFRWTVVGAALMAFAAGAYIAWLFDFFMREKGASESLALALLGAASVCGLLGVLAGGAIGDRLARRRAAGRQLTIVLGFSLSVPCALAVLYLPLGPGFSASALALMFFVSWYHGPLAASVDDLVPGERAATAQGLYIACMHLLGTAPASVVVGELADHVGLQTALLVPTAAMLLAALAFAASLRGVARDSVVKRAGA